MRQVDVVRGVRALKGSKIISIGGISWAGCLDISEHARRGHWSILEIAANVKRLNVKPVELGASKI